MCTCDLYLELVAFLGVCYLLYNYCDELKCMMFVLLILLRGGHTGKFTTLI